MFKKLLVAVASSTVALSAFALEGNQMEKCIELTDGSTVHVFTGGNMGMQDKWGRAFSMEPGHVMQTKDGQKIVMKGNEAMRVAQLLDRAKP